MNLIESNNHFVFVKDGKNYVIDTGCRIPKQIIAQYVNKLGLDELVGLHVDGIIGADVIFENGITIDRKNKEVSFESKQLAHSFTTSLGAIGYTTDDLKMNGNAISNIYVDSGSRITYLNEKVVNEMGLEPMNLSFEDYNPMTGKFKSDVYQVEKSIGEVVLNDCEVASLKPSIALMVGSNSFNGIFSLFDLNCDIISITKDRIYFE